MESIWLYCQTHELVHLAAIITLAFESYLNQASYSLHFFLLFSYMHLLLSVTACLRCRAIMNLNVCRLNVSLLSMGEITVTFCFDPVQWRCLCWGLLWWDSEERVLVIRRNAGSLAHRRRGETWWFGRISEHSEPVNNSVWGVMLWVADGLCLFLCVVSVFQCVCALVYFLCV